MQMLIALLVYKNGWLVGSGPSGGGVSFGGVGYLLVSTDSAVREGERESVGVCDKYSYLPTDRVSALYGYSTVYTGYVWRL